MKLNNRKIESIVKSALREDIGKKDVTTTAIIPKGLKVRATIFARESGVLAGLDIARATFRLVDKSVKFRPLLKDGQKVKPGLKIVQLSGLGRSILMAERTALNFLSGLSGIATLTDEFVQKVKDPKVKVMDTRKTTPGLRALEKYAVRVGGGHNHRMGLYAQVLIKDNHISVVRRSYLVSRRKDIKLEEIIKQIRKKLLQKIPIEIEVKNLKELKDVLKAKPEIIMLDNFSINQIKKAVRIRDNFLRVTSQSAAKRSLPEGDEPRAAVLLEVSGGVNLQNIREIAATGVERISVGALTHSARALDISLEII